MGDIYRQFRVAEKYVCSCQVVSIDTILGLYLYGSVGNSQVIRAANKDTILSLSSSLSLSLSGLFISALTLL
jgi:hypothetical protein